MEQKIYISWIINGLNPSYKRQVKSLTDAYVVLELLSYMDLSPVREASERIKEKFPLKGGLIEAVRNEYISYRQKHQCNHPDLIDFNVGSVVDEQGYDLVIQYEEDEHIAHELFQQVPEIAENKNCSIIELLEQLKILSGEDEG